MKYGSNVGTREYGDMPGSQDLHGPFVPWRARVVCAQPSGP